MSDQRVSQVFPTDAQRPPGSQKSTAALGVGARNGGERHEASQPHRGQCRKTHPKTRLWPIWSDDRHLQGWVSIGEIAADIVRKLEGGR
jgi:hypothetical protein